MENVYAKALLSACEQMSDSYKKKKECDQSCYIARNNDLKCTCQCETVQYWLDRFTQNALDEMEKNRCKEY